MKAVSGKAMGVAKRSGEAAAKEWCKSASKQDQLDVANCPFEYGKTLDRVFANNAKVPNSMDGDFSWGFYRKVKSHVFHVMQQN